MVVDALTIVDVTDKSNPVLVGKVFEGIPKYAKLPESEHERAKHAYRQALDDAINDQDAKQNCRRSSTSSTRAATPRRRNAWRTIGMRSSCTCATRPATAGGGGQRICSSARSARSSAAPR